MGPVLAYDGVRAGNPVDVLGRRSGRAASGNASRDRCNYLPLPVSFGVDPDRHRIAGIATALGSEVLTIVVLPLVHLSRDPTSCRVTAVRYGLAAR